MQLQHIKRALFSKHAGYRYRPEIKSPQQQGFNPFSYILVGLLIGVILTWLYCRQRSRESCIKQKTSGKPLGEKEQGEGAVEEEEINEGAHDSTEEDI
jgi:hypothetical protein